MSFGYVSDTTCCEEMFKKKCYWPYLILKVLEGLGQEKLSSKKSRSKGVREAQDYVKSMPVVDSEKALQALSSAELGGEFQVYPDEETGNLRLTAY